MYEYLINKKDNHPGKLCGFSFSIIITLIVLCSGCLFSAESDWEYEFYYYVDIQSSSNNNFSISIPVARTFIIGPLHYSHKITLDNLSIEKGNCTCDVIYYNSKSYLQINGSSFVSISSSFIVMDGGGDVSIAKDKSNITSMIYSNSSNISLVVDSRGVIKTNEKKSWDLYYSAIINPTMDFPIPIKTTWKNHLSEEYYISLEQGWKPYTVNENYCSGLPIK